MNKLIKFTPILCALALAGCGSGSGNSAPLFTQSNLSFTLNEDTAFSGQVSATDDDPLSYTLAQSPSNGIITLEANGEFTYTPHADYFGEDSTTISASDGSLSANVVVRFIIENINDAPTISTTNVTFTTSTTSVGKINTSDVDGDAVSITLLTPPSSGVISINSETGEFSYEAQTLTTQNDEFTVSYTDGIISEPLTATISLSPSYVTNEDKRNYYYSSDKSHLKQADLITENINDELSRYSIYQTQAAAYARAGFLTTAQEYLLLINEQTALAGGLRDVGVALDSINKIEEGAEYRSRALAAYNQYLAEKGFENINRNDASWLLGLVNDYMDVGQTDEAKSLLNTINSYAEIVREEQYSTTYGYFQTAFKNAAEGALDVYAADPSDANKLTAQTFAAALVNISSNTGYQIQGGSGEFAGQKVEKIRALYTAWAAEVLFRANSLELAREYVNLAMSLYGVTGIDENYDFPTSEYSEATLGTYTYPLQTLAGLIEALYDLEENPAFALVTSDFDISGAKQVMYSFSVAESIMTGSSVSDAAAEAFTFFTEKGDYNEFFKSLIETSNNAGTAKVLYQFGFTEQAKEVLTYAGEFISSDDYISAESSASYLAGSNGCGLLVSISKEIGTDTTAAANTCLTMLNKLSSGTLRTLTDTSAITVHSNVMVSLDRGGLTDEITAVNTQLLSKISALEDIEDRFEYSLETLGYLVDAGFTNLALTTFNSAIAEVNENLSTLTSDQLLDILEALKNESISVSAPKTGFWERFSMLSSMGANAGTITDFRSTYSSVKTQTSALVARIETLILAQADIVIIDAMEDLIEAHTLLGEYDLATALVTNDVNGEADQLELYTTMAELIASIDDFRDNRVASVDTDHDGFPNFFLANVTDEDIAISGLTADEDADNDGITDTEDSTPIGE
ncbi:cadherin-like domain-containing protein [Pseudoalteromonas arctica]|uniref:Cadherin-like domain-containing protein n=1 Tax=Pseudoalteromonas arctica TaxID=394751 RepID=A0AAP6Y6W3_9GAMM|nr:Ig-like domain-containing protein [Pseudoalteromonas arctica]NMP04495.1 cadherin-like domain-containing protein [Pseudoalteromonas arctica]